MKLVLLLGEYMNRQYHGRYHAKGQNLRWLLRERTTGCCATTTS